MQELTRDKIARNIKNTPYSFDVNYSLSYKITFNFSSKLYMEKFKERMLINREHYSLKLTKRFHIKMKNNVLSDLLLYKSIEKRGFYILLNEEGIECLDNIVLDGEMMTINN